MLCPEAELSAGSDICEVTLAHLRPAVHRTILVVDVAGFGDRSRTNEHQLAVRAGLYRALQRAFEIAGIPWTDCLCEDRGDGVYLLASSLIPKVRFVEDLPGALVAELREHNGNHPDEARIRLRMALHAGEIRFDAHGKISQASILAFRLVDAPALKSALADSTAELALIVSPYFYDEVVRHAPQANPDSFHEVTVTVKETTTSAWISLPAPLDRPRQTPVHHNGSVSMSPDLFYAAVDIMELIPCMSTENDRALVIKRLRPAIAGSIRYHPGRRSHVMSILDTCRDYTGGVGELLAAMANIERADSLPLQRLVDLLGGTTT